MLLCAPCLLLLYGCAASCLSASRTPGEGRISYEEALACGAQVVVNTSPAGMYPNNDALALDVAKMPGLEAVLDAAERFADTAGVLVPEWLENYFDEFASMLTTLRTSLSDGMTVENLREAATAFNERKAEVEETIRAKLSEETVAEIDAVQANIEERLDAAKAALQKAVETAKEEAEAYLAACKADRREGTA